MSLSSVFTSFPSYTPLFPPTCLLLCTSVDCHYLLWMQGTRLAFTLLFFLYYFHMWLCVVWLLHYVSKCFICVLSRDHFPGLMACLWGAWNTGARQSRSVSSRRTTVSSKLIRQTFATCALNSKLKSLRPINCHMKCPLFSERNISSLSYFWNNSFRSSSCPTDLNCFHYIQSWDTHCTDHLIPFAQWCWERCVGR